MVETLNAVMVTAWPSSHRRRSAPRWLWRKPHGREVLASTRDFLRTSCPAICPTTGLTNPKDPKASQNRSQVHFRIFDQQVCQFLIVSLSLGPNLGPTFLSKRILPKIASSKINLWVFHGFSMFCSGRILTHPFLNQDLQGPWHEDFGSSAVARDHHLHREHQAPWLLKSPSAEIMWP